MNRFRNWLIGFLIALVDCTREQEQTERMGQMRAGMMSKPIR